MVESDYVFFEMSEHFEKMTYRNRYEVAGANGLIMLSVPLQQGRNQRTAMRNVLISNANNWQKQHWRTLVSAYKRAPFFEYYEAELQQLFESHYESLLSFNIATTKWLKEKINIDFQIMLAAEYNKHYEEQYTDLRNMRTNKSNQTNAKFPMYYQLFSDRNGFMPNLSILDLLFSEGPYTVQWLRDNKAAIIQ